jgi:hypothetical protein
MLDACALQAVTVAYCGCVHDALLVPAVLQVSLLHRREVMRKEHRVLLGLHELLTYGLKGVAAYAHHAEMLGKVDPDLDNMFEEVCYRIPLPVCLQHGGGLDAFEMNHGHCHHIGCIRR